MNVGGYGSGLGSMHGSGLSKLSPYLNIDPSYLQTETPEYIFNQVSVISTSLFVIVVVVYGAFTNYYKGVYVLDRLRNTSCSIFKMVRKRLDVFGL